MAIPVRPRPRRVSRCFEVIYKHKDLQLALEMFKGAHTAAASLHGIMVQISDALRRCQPHKASHVDYIIQGFNAVAEEFGDALFTAEQNLKRALTSGGRPEIRDLGRLKGQGAKSEPPAPWSQTQSRGRGAAMDEGGGYTSPGAPQRGGGGGGGGNDSSDSNDWGALRRGGGGGNMMRSSQQPLLQEGTNDSENNPDVQRWFKDAEAAAISRPAVAAAAAETTEGGTDKADDPLEMLRAYMKQQEKEQRQEQPASPASAGAGSSPADHVNNSSNSSGLNFGGLEGARPGRYVF